MKRSVFPFCLLAIAFLFAACDSNDMSMDTAVSFEQASYQVSEASQGLDVTVTLDASPDEAVTIPITVGGSAIAGEDYQELPDAVTIEAGSTTGTLTITPIDNAALNSEARTIELLLETGELDGYASGETASTEITITDDEMTGSYAVSFDEGSYTTNEYEQDTLNVIVRVNQPVPVDVDLDFETAGSATSANYELLNSSIRIRANETIDTVQVAIKDTENYGNSETLILRLLDPSNEAVSIEGTTETEIEIVNPIANVAVYAEDADFARLFCYNTFSDVAVPETGRRNFDASAGVVFDESFAFTIYPSRDQDPSVDPNVFGFGSPLWSEDNFTRNTNILNMVEFYSGGGPNTVDEGVSSASAGLYYPEFFRLTPDAPGATTGTVSLVLDEVRVYKPDQTDDGVTNPESFVIGLSSEGGTYDETEGTINITITFDETEVGNGFVTRRFELSERRPSS